MSEWVDEREWIAYQWPYVLNCLGGEAEVERIAREVGSFQRPREVESASELLQLLMLWSVAGCSLRETALIAEEAGLASISNVGLLKRFAHCGPLVDALLGRLLLGGERWTAPGHRVRLIDATTIRGPGSRGTDYRVHVGFDLTSSMIDQLEITDAKGGETFRRFSFAASEIVIGDRGYAHRAGIQAISEANAFFIVRLPYQSVPLEHADGSRVDVLDLVRSTPEAAPGEHRVWVMAEDGTRVACRLVTVRKTEVAAERARRTMTAEAKKKGRQPSHGALELAGYVCLLTNLPASFSAEQVLALYRLRWQIEMKFKTVKGIIDLGAVPVKTHELAKTYIGTKLIAALVIHALTHQYESFFPWGYPLIERWPAPEPMAPDEVSV
jgi:hypothetical protein